VPATLPPEVAPLKTHWSRILYYDLFDADAMHEHRRLPQPHKELRMPSSDPFRDPPPIVERSPLAGALVLLGIYVVMYLSVAAALHVLEPANASTGDATGQAAAPATSTQLSQSQGEDAPADCRPGARFDSRCFTD